MNISGPVHRLTIDLVDVVDGEIPEDISGYFYYREIDGSLSKQYFYSRQRRLMKSMTEEEVEYIRRALTRAGFDVESFTVFHSPHNSFTYRRAFQKAPLW